MDSVTPDMIMAIGVAEGARSEDKDKVEELAEQQYEGFIAASAANEFMLVLNSPTALVVLPPDIHKGMLLSDEAVVAVFLSEWPPTVTPSDLCLD